MSDNPFKGNLELLESVEELPRDSYELIDLLDAVFPPRCILPGETVESAHRYAGIRQLVDELVQWKADEVERLAEEAQEVADDGMPRVLRK